MPPSLVIWLISVGIQSASPPQVPNRLQGLRGDVIEQMHREQLGNVQSRLAALNESIDLFDRLANDPTVRHTPEQRDDIHRRLAYWRQHVRHLKRLQLEMEAWARQRKVNPGPGTDLAAIDKLDQLCREWDDWKAAWEAGRILPPPREKK